MDSPVRRLFLECKQNVCNILTTFSSFGFILNKKKSHPTPSHQVRSLGFFINSITMTVSLPPDKISNAVQLCSAALVIQTFSIHHLASIIGTLVSLFPACPFGRAHYRGLERLKIHALRSSRGSYSSSCSLNADAVSELQWWIHNVPHTCAPISRGNPTDVLFTDSSEGSWGSFFNGVKARGHFTPQEAANIIAVKELFAAFFGFKSFLRHFSGSHVLIRSDNIAAVAYIRDMGGMKNTLMDSTAKKLWDLAYEHGIWISASFIRGSDNSDADHASRILNDRTEWALPVPVFNKLCDKFFFPSIDLFAS